MTSNPRSNQVVSWRVALTWSFGLSAFLLSLVVIGFGGCPKKRPQIPEIGMAFNDGYEAGVRTGYGTRREGGNEADVEAFIEAAKQLDTGFVERWFE